MSEEFPVSNEPCVQIQPVENGYIITASYGQKKNHHEDMNSILTSINKSMQDSENPLEGISKAFSSIDLKEKTTRKPIEYYVTKTFDETVKLIEEILGTMNVKPVQGP